MISPNFILLSGVFSNRNGKILLTLGTRNIKILNTLLRVPSVNRIFPLRVLTAGAISLFLNITGAIAPMAPVLNTPLNVREQIIQKIYFHTFPIPIFQGAKQAVLRSK